jgi:hypothetical protein
MTASRRTNERRLVVAFVLALAGGVTSCVTGGSANAPMLSVTEIARRLPARVKASEREGWARDIAAAITAVGREPTAERVCAVVAVIDQESGFKVDPEVPSLPQIVRAGLEKKLDALGPLSGVALKALLAGHAPGTRESFGKRIDRLRTERELDLLFRDIAATYKEEMPGPYVVASALSRLFGSGYLETLNPVTTAGSMQVKVGFARGLPENRGLSDGDVRDVLYTRYGGVRAGTARLLDYEASYDDVVFRFADYNAGVFASRNAAFQSVLADLTGKRLALDGDLLAYEEDGDRRAEESESLKAMLAFGRSHDMWEWTVRRNAGTEKEQDFEDTSLWEKARAAWQASHGKEPPYARIPEVALSSPKLSGRRSTAWFANAVKKRYTACRAAGR